MRAYSGYKGRKQIEDISLPTRDPFLNDYFTLLQSKAFRRLAYKTQVISMPDNPHVRTRAVHTHEVVAVSAMIAEALDLNVSLCMAIAAGHDIGHAPYGHLGETVLSELGNRPFRHNINGVVIAQQIERKGEGLNLAYETLEGMLKHCRETEEIIANKGEPYEYAVVTHADKIAFTFSDLNDAIRYGYLRESQLPSCVSMLGENQRARTKNAINALVSESREKGFVQFSEGYVFECFNELAEFMHGEFYSKIDLSLQETILRRLHGFFSEMSELEPTLSVSLLTDAEANYFGSLLLKCKKPSKEQIKHFGLFEIVPNVGMKKIDYSEPDLGWNKR